MDPYQAPALTQKTAASIAREWIDGRVNRPAKSYTWSQMRWLMDQLDDRCVAESLRLGEDEDALCARLDGAHNIISAAWYSVAPEYATRWRTSTEEEPSAEEKERIETARHRLWARHDPKRSFTEGLRSEHYVAIDKASLHSTIADYLDRPYLRHQILDWIFLDMTISREVTAYGEHLKSNGCQESAIFLEFITATTSRRAT